MFAYEFDIWAFSELSILEVGGQMGDLCKFLFTVFILVGVLGSSMDIYRGSGMNIFCGFPWFVFS